MKSNSRKIKGLKQDSKHEREKREKDERLKDWKEDGQKTGKLESGGRGKRKRKPQGRRIVRAKMKLETQTTKEGKKERREGSKRERCRRVGGSRIWGDEDGGRKQAIREGGRPREGEAGMVNMEE